MYKYQYPVLLTDNKEGGFVLTFRDVPEIVSEIWSIDELEKTGADALITGADMYYETKQMFPEPSALQENEVLVSLPISAVVKILLHNAMLLANIRPSDLAKRMGKLPQEVNRIIDLKHKTKIDTIQDAFKAIGKDLNVSITD